MNAIDFIQKILDDVGESGGLGFWTESDVISAINYIQNEIVSETENILVTSSAIPITQDTAEVAVSPYMLRIVSAYRVYGSSTLPIEVMTEQQVSEEDINWFTTKGATLKAIITDVAQIGSVRVYPIQNNALNSLIVRYVKLPTPIEINDIVSSFLPDRDLLILEAGTKALLYSLEREGKDKAKGDFYLKMYADGINSIKSRVRRSRAGQFNTLVERY